MRKIVKLTESDLNRIVKRVIKENEELENAMTYPEYIEDVHHEVKRRFNVTDKNADEIVSHYIKTIEYGFFDEGGYTPVKKLVDEFMNDGKIKWSR